ncbi:MAG: right-handed parallel beta-helix repeat-containing protein, partial [Planctomycetota bacterium]
GGAFFQHPWGANPPNPAFFAIAPELEFDSYHTSPADYPNTTYSGDKVFLSGEETDTYIDTSWFDNDDTGDGSFVVCQFTVIPDDEPCCVDGMFAYKSEHSAGQYFELPIRVPDECYDTWYVDDDAPGDPGPGDPSISDPLEDGSASHPFDAIQEAIDVARDHDVVLVLAGTYTGGGNRNLDYAGKSITVRSDGGPSTCIIDCEGEGRGFIFDDTEPIHAILDGVTITNGNGGAVRCNPGSPTITNCVLTQNYGSYGGGVSISAGAPILRNCAITGNQANQDGGGVSCTQASVTIVNCTIAGNTGPVNGGGVAVRPGATATITNSVLWGNHSENGPQIAMIGFTLPATLTVSYSTVQGGQDAVYVGSGCTLIWGDNNLDTDPLLINDDTHLRAGSPCRNAGDPAGSYAGQRDVDGEPRVPDLAVDMGADEFIDTDEDALPDWWEQEHFGTPTGADPAADDDGDGLTNLEEYIRACDPLLPPVTYFVDVAGDDSWDGLAPQWDGEHGPKATIQAAIDQVTAPDSCWAGEVVVADGVYTGAGNKNLDYQGKNITVRSTNGPSSCTIDCEGDGRGFYFHNGETREAILDGFTISNAFSLLDGGGVRCEHSSPTIVNCRFFGNRSVGRSHASGGAFLCTQGDPLIRNCEFVRNTAAGANARGGALSVSGSNVVIDSCTFVRNDAFAKQGDGQGGGIYAYDSHLTLTNCTLSRNTAARYGGAITCYGETEVVLSNCLLWENVAPEGTAIALLRAVGSVVYCDVEGGQDAVYAADGGSLLWGDGNFDSDPLLTADGVLTSTVYPIGGSCASTARLTSPIQPPMMMTTSFQTSKSIP